MDDDKLFELVRKNFNTANKDYIKEQVKAALKEPAMAKRETLDGLIDWIVEAGCTGMNEYYRKFVFSAVAYLLKEQEAVTEYVMDDYQPTCKACGFRPYAGYIPTLEWMRELGFKYCPQCGQAVTWNDKRRL